MQVCELKAYKGRNIYSHQKVVKMIVDLEEYNDLPTNQIDHFNEELVSLLPGLKQHYCSPGYEGGFLDRLEEGTYLAHVIEHIALEILNKLGHQVSFGRARQIGNSSCYDVVFAYKDESAGLAAGRLSVKLAESLCKKSPFDFPQGFAKIKEMLQRDGLGPSTLAIIDAALERGIPVTRIHNSSIIRLGYGVFHKKIECTLSENTSCIAADIASNKSITKSLLYEAGIPVPNGTVCYTLDEALSAAEEIGVPVVVKPANGNQGRGVSLQLQTADEITKAFHIAIKIEPAVLVEEYIEGRDYRILIVGDQVVAVALRIPAQIMGDGIHTIAQLVEIANQDERRGVDHEKPLTKISLDDITFHLLDKQGFTLDSIPEDGVAVYLKSNGNISTGGEAIDCTDKIHPYNRALAIRAARIIGLDIAGIDISCQDICIPINQNNGAVIEVNAAPGIRMHLFPSKGQARKVGKAIIDMLFPSGTKHSIPIVSITGTNGKTTTTRMIAHILRAYGLNVGMTTTEGIYINDQCIMKGDTTGPASAQVLLTDKAVEAAVLETARGGIIRSGLGYDLSDVGVFTNISEDHLGLDGVETMEDLLNVKTLVVEAVKSNGYAVLNADDPMVVQAAKRVKANIIYFSRQEDNLVIHKHVAEGGIAVYLKEGHITIATGNGCIQSISIMQIPATLGGKLQHNIENSLAAVSVAFALKCPINVIEAALRSFYCDEIHNPGRFNIHNIRDFRVIVDYGHNIAGYNQITDAVKKLGASRLVGIIGVPGDRDNETIKSIGRIAGKSFDRIIIKEDVDLRGRNEGEIARLLFEGAVSSGMDKNSIQYERYEVNALKKAINEASAGDIIVIFYENLEKINDIIQYTLQSIEDHSESIDLLLRKA